MNTCVNRDTVIVTVNPLPTVSAGGNLQLCINDTILIGGAPTGPLNATFVWTPAASLLNATVSNPLAHPIISTNYIVTVTDTNGCVNKDTMNVNVNLLPAVNAGAPRSICFGDSTLLGGTPIAPNSSFLWSPLAGLSSSVIPQPMASPAITTDYILTVTENTTSCVNRDTVNVNVIPLPLALTGPNVPICIGDSIQIGDLALLTNTYIWTPATGLSNDSISNPFAHPTTTTTYTIDGTTAGCSGSSVITLTVINCSTGLANLYSDNKFSIYPNPTQGIITINFGGTYSGKISVVNTLNQIILSKNVSNAESIQINLSKFAKRIYFVKISSNKNANEFIKVIKN